MDSRTLQSTRVLHRWIGLGLGLFLVFVALSGVVALLAPEILAWEKPALRLAAPDRGLEMSALDRAWRNHLPPDAEFVNIEFPLGLENAAEINYLDGGLVRQVHVHPVTGVLLDDSGQRASEFLWRLHGTLWLGDAGRYLQGLAGVAMLVMLMTGVILHRRIFAEMFRLRSGGLPRSFFSDLHKLAGTWLLPFNGVVSFSGAVLGLIPFVIVVVAIFVFQGDRAAAIDALLGPFPPADGPVAETRPIGEAYERAKSELDGFHLDRIRVRDPGAADATILVEGLEAGALANRQGLHYHGVTGEVMLKVDGAPSAANRIFDILGIVHFGDYAGGASRTLHLLLGVFTLLLPVAGMRIWYETVTRNGYDAAAVRAMARPAAVMLGAGGGMLSGMLLVLWATRLLDGITDFIPLAQGLFVGSILAFAAIGALGPRPGSVWRAVLLTNGILLTGIPVLEVLFAVAPPADASLSAVPGVMAFNAGAGLLGLLCLASGLRRRQEKPRKKERKNETGHVHGIG